MHNFQTNAGYSMKNKGTKYCILDEKHAKIITLSNFYADDLLA